MKINVVLAARWSAEHAGPPNPAATITMTQIRRLVPLETSPVPIYGSSQYDVYCWAKAGFLMLDLLFASNLIYCCIASNQAAWSESEKSQDDIESTRIKMNQFGVKFFPCLEDDAQTTTGFDRPNYMSHTYVSAAVVNPLLPAGGATMGLWVTDLTPPTINYVSAESISSDTIQMTLQLDEPGTIWRLGRTEMVRNNLQAYGKEKSIACFVPLRKNGYLYLPIELLKTFYKVEGCPTNPQSLVPSVLGCWAMWWQLACGSVTGLCEYHLAPTDRRYVLVTVCWPSLWIYQESIFILLGTARCAAAEMDTSLDLLNCKESEVQARIAQ